MDFIDKKLKNALQDNFLKIAKVLGWSQNKTHMYFKVKKISNCFYKNFG